MNFRFVGIVMGIALILSCKNPVETDVDNIVRIRIKSDTAIPFIDSSRIKISMYASDVGVADAPATILTTIDTVLSSTNGEYIFRFNKRDFEAVQYSSGRGEYSYYFGFNIDLDHDGQICIGDYVQDYAKSPFVSYTQVESREMTIELYTKAVTYGNCYEF